MVVNCLAAGRERLGGRGLCCWAGKRWMTVALLEGGRTARRDAGWEGAGLLGGRVVADCWAGEWTTVARLRCYTTVEERGAGRGQDC